MTATWSTRCNSNLEIQPDESTLSLFKGTYSQMKEERERLARWQLPQKRPITQSSDTRLPNNRKKIAAPGEMLELENQIAEIEAKLAEISRKLRTAPSTRVKCQAGKEYQTVQKEMDSKLAEWEALQA